MRLFASSGTPAPVCWATRTLPATDRPIPKEMTETASGTRSVGQPRDRDHRAAYAILTTRTTLYGSSGVAYDTAQSSTRWDADLRRQTGFRLNEGRWPQERHVVRQRQPADTARDERICVRDRYCMAWSPQSRSSTAGRRRRRDPRCLPERVKEATPRPAGSAAEFQTVKRPTSDCRTDTSPGTRFPRRQRSPGPKGTAGTGRPDGRVSRLRGA